MCRNMRIKKYLLIFCLVLLSASCFGARIPIIVDTDCDMDDMMAILYLLKKRNANVLAITTTGTGMAHWKYSAPNILDLVDLAGHPDVPVSYGAKQSLSNYTEFPEHWRKSVDQVFNIPLPKNNHPASPYPSWELMTKMIQESPQKVTILALAPLTNIAIALQKNPSIKDNIERIVLSGGSIHTDGNIVGKIHGSKNQCAEYNILVDAKAAQIVFESGVPITLCPLDATEDAPIDQKIYNRFKNEQRNPSANFVFEVIKPFVASQSNTKVYLWDPVAAAVLTTPSLGNYQTMNLIVNQEKGPTYACTLQRPDGMPVDVCTSINSNRFYNLFFKTISRGR